MGAIYIYIRRKNGTTMGNYITKEKEIADFLRYCCLEFMVIALKTYQQTNDKEFVNLAKFYGEMSARLKNTI